MTKLLIDTKITFMDKMQVKIEQLAFFTCHGLSATVFAAVP
jgi:hypothetical protein